jgi:hypothetical protein
VVVTAIDRLGRSVAEVTRTIAELGERPNPVAQPARRQRGDRHPARSALVRVRPMITAHSLFTPFGVHGYFGRDSRSD